MAFDKTNNIAIGGGNTTIKLRTLPNSRNITCSSCSR